MSLDVSEILRRVSDTVEFGDMDIVGVNTRGIFQNTPLHVVISWREPMALRVLIDNGADVNAKGERGFTPLHHAIMMRNADAVDILMVSGADPMLKNDDSDDAFDLAKKVNDAEINDRLNGVPRSSIH
jgi:ankyrin repeat protein